VTDPAKLHLEWGTPAPRRKPGPAPTIAALKQRLCLHGAAGWRGADSWRANDAMTTYRALPETVRVALRHAAEAGCRCDVGSHTAANQSKYEPRAARATVRGVVPDHVAVVLTLAGFVRRAAHERAGNQYWSYKP